LLLPDDAGTLKAMLIAERVRNERLLQIIKELQRHRFGRRAETLPEDQMLLGLEDVEQVAARPKAMLPTRPSRQIDPPNGA
jgi:transposase